MRHDAQRGFTLVELAIVVAIIGISIAGAMAGVSALRENTRLKETNIALRDAEHALTLYVMQNGRLPFAAALGGNGTENGTSAYGEVPYGVLGLGRGDVTDGWGEVVRYAVDAAFAAGGTLPCTDDNLATNTETLGILDADSTEGDDTSFAKVAYVLISTGGDLDPEAPNDELEGDSNASFSLFRSEGVAANFDDIVTGRPANQILRDGGCRLKPKDTYSTEAPSTDYCDENPGAAECTPPPPPPEEPPPPPEPPPASGAGVLNRSNLQNSTGLEWGANGDTGYEEVRVNDTRIRAGNGRIASRESGGNDGLGTTGAGGGLREDEYVDFIIDAPKQYYTVQLNSFGNNTSAEIRAYRNGAQVGSPHTYSGSNATNAGVIYANRSFPDGSGGTLMFDTLRVIGTGKNSFFIYSMNFAE